MSAPHPSQFRENSMSSKAKLMQEVCAFRQRLSSRQRKSPAVSGGARRTPDQGPGSSRRTRITPYHVPVVLFVITMFGMPRPRLVTPMVLALVSRVQYSNW